MKHYLTEAVLKLIIYKTPENILKTIERDLLIKNPPYKNK